MSSALNPQSYRSSLVGGSENFNPNISTCNSVQKQRGSPSPSTNSEKSKKLYSKRWNQSDSPCKKVQERRFLVAKKNPNPNPNPEFNSNAILSCRCKGKMGVGLRKCPCVAYQNLRSSQDEFFQEFDEMTKEGLREEEEEEEEGEKNPLNIFKYGDYEAADHQLEGEAIEDDHGSPSKSQGNQDCEMGSSKIKRRREKLLEEARNSIPEQGFGRVRHLVKAFERLMSIRSCSRGLKAKDEKKERRMKWGLPGLEPLTTTTEAEGSSSSFAQSKWALPGLEPLTTTEAEGSSSSFAQSKWALPGLQPLTATETEGSSSSVVQSAVFFTSEDFGLDSNVYSSLDSKQASFTSRSSDGCRRSRRNSSDTSGSFGGRRWKKQQLKVTRQRPFKLRTEQRGRFKEQEFLHKMQEMFAEEEKRRIPMAQGLPWTTDQPEFLVKPPVKGSTRPIDLKLHSDVRAVERAEFDHQVAAKFSYLEQYRLERERQRKLEEEEDIKRLRKELVPKAQPMPYFDRPFIPKRSLKLPTIPREPKFHIPQHKKIKCMSLSDIDIYTNQCS